MNLLKPAIAVSIISMSLISINIGATTDTPEWVAKWMFSEPFVRTKKYIRWQDIQDQKTKQMLSEAADDLAAFMIQSRNTDLRPAPKYLSVFLPGTEFSFRRPPLKNNQPDVFWSGPPYAITSIGPERLGFLAFLTAPGENRGYVEGYVFERQLDGHWRFACHLSGFPELREWHRSEAPYSPALGTKIPVTSKPEC